MFHFRPCINTLMLIFMYFYSLSHNKFTDGSVEVFYDLIVTHKSLSDLRPV